MRWATLFCVCLEQLHHLGRVGPEAVAVVQAEAVERPHHLHLARADVSPRSSAAWSSPSSTSLEVVPQPVDGPGRPGPGIEVARRHVDERDGVTGLLGESAGLLQERTTPHVSDEDQLLGEHPQQSGPELRRTDEPLQQVLEQLDLLGIALLVLVERGAHPHQERVRHGLVEARVLGEPRRLAKMQQRVTGAVGRHLRLPEPGQEMDPERDVVIVVEVLQRERVPVHRVVGRGEPEGLLPRAGCVLDRLVGIRGGGLAVVVRQIGDDCIEITRVLGLDRLGDLAVRAYPASGRELLEQRRAHQRVAEPVAVEAHFVDEIRRLRGIEQVERAILVDARDRRRAPAAGTPRR